MPRKAGIDASGALHHIIYNAIQVSCGGTCAGRRLKRKFLHRRAKTRGSGLHS